MFIESVLRAGRHTMDEIESAHRRRAAHFVDDMLNLTILLRRDHPAHRALAANLPRERTRVDPLNRADSMSLEVIGERHLGVRTGGFLDDVADDESSDLRDDTLLDDRLHTV